MPSLAAQLRETPEKSNRQVAEGLGVDDKTVGTVRRGLEARAEIPHVATTTDTLGRSQPARKPIRTTFVDTLEARGEVSKLDTVTAGMAPSARGMTGPVIAPAVTIRAAPPVGYRSRALTGL